MSLSGLDRSTRIECRRGAFSFTEPLCLQVYCLKFCELSEDSEVSPNNASNALLPVSPLDGVAERNWARCASGSLCRFASSAETTIHPVGTSLLEAVAGFGEASTFAGAFSCCTCLRCCGVARVFLLKRQRSFDLMQRWFWSAARARFFQRPRPSQKLGYANRTDSQPRVWASES